MNIFNTILIEPLANGLILFYRLLGGNMGLAIIGFSFALRFLLNPLTKPYLESMKRMKEFEPQLARLKERHKDDRKKLLEAQTEFYRQKGINPGGGCLPYFFQIVILIALFNVFTRVLAPNGDVATKFNELLYSPLKFRQGETINTQFLYLDVTQPDAIRLPFSPFPLPGPILILAAILQFASARMMTPYQKLEEKLSKKTPGSADDMQVAMQKSMTYTFPLFTLIIGLSFPSGLALYWLLFSFWQLVQQYKTSGWGGLTPFVSKWKKN
ncbi:MAG: YidC/Oxa1 family membrane protein insertase [Patescibacteria group bacterium]